MLDLFASEYHWSRNEILNEIYLDEYFIQKDIIDKRNRQAYLKQAELQILPNLEKKEIQKFFDNLTREDKPQLVNVKTDFDAIERAKRQMGM